jgi:hypothetical protein
MGLLVVAGWQEQDGVKASSGVVLTFCCISPFVFVPKGAWKLSVFVVFEALYTRLSFLSFYFCLLY